MDVLWCFVVGSDVVNVIVIIPVVYSIALSYSLLFISSIAIETLLDFFTLPLAVTT